MCYTLGLLFEYYRYHHDAVVRIYADDRLVDELSLSSDINMKASILGMFSSFIGPTNKTRVMFTPEKLFLFEIDERHLHDRIRIEVQNDNNNHNNGFMNKFSYLKFHHIFLLPSCLLESKNWQKLYERLGECSIQQEESNQVFPNIILPHDIILKSHSKPIQNNETWRGFALGGSFSMQIPLSKKHGVIHLGKLSPGRIGVDMHYSFVLWAFNQLNTST